MREYRTYNEDLEILGISEEEYDNIINYIYDKSNDEILALVKAIKAGAKVLKPVQFALERVLTMLSVERKEAYDLYFN